MAKEQGADRERAAEAMSWRRRRRREAELVESQNRVAALNHGLERRDRDARGEARPSAGGSGAAREDRERLRPGAQQAAELAESQALRRARRSAEQELATVSKGREKFEARVTELREELKTCAGRARAFAATGDRAGGATRLA